MFVLQNKLGRYSDKPRDITKLPLYIFQDYSLNGGLHVFLMEAFSLLEKRSLSWEVATSDEGNFYMELARLATVSLLKASQLSWSNRLNSVFLCVRCAFTERDSATTFSILQ